MTVVSVLDMLSQNDPNDNKINGPV